MANEVIFSIPIIGSAVWTTITGDTFIPSVVGAGFALYFRHEREGGKNGITFRDIASVVTISVLVGLLAGPYLADQLPEGKDVVGIGALLASFLGVPAFRGLARLDLTKLMQSLADLFSRGSK
jgi:pilus assembly protein TadC